MTVHSKLPVDSAHLIETLELIKQVSNLVNPSSGIANDFLNQYNEVLLLVENLPVLLPEMVEDLLAWKRKSYEEYFATSPLPGGDIAIRVYNKLDSAFKSKFEKQVERINKVAEKAIAAIAERERASEELNAEDIEAFCEQISKKLREEIEKAAKLVNYGLGMAPETSQALADRLMQA